MRIAELLERPLEDHYKLVDCWEVEPPYLLAQGPDVRGLTFYGGRLEFTDLAEERMSPQMRCITALAMSGLSGLSIAREMEISSGTVSYYLADAYELVHNKPKPTVHKELAGLARMLIQSNPSLLELTEAASSAHKRQLLGLTRKELEAVSLLQYNSTNVDIGEALGVTASAIKVRLSKARAKLGIYNRELLATAVVLSEMEFVPPTRSGQIDSVKIGNA